MCSSIHLVIMPNAPLLSLATLVNVANAIRGTCLISLVWAYSSQRIDKVPDSPDLLFGHVSDRGREGAVEHLGVVEYPDSFSVRWVSLQARGRQKQHKLK